MPTERRILHVLPHPGGGGEKYVDLLDAMPCYSFTRTYLAQSPKPSPLELLSGVAQAHRRARKCDLVHAHGEVAAGLCLPMLAARASVVTFNGLHLVRRADAHLHRAAVLNLHAVLRAADRAICVCNAELGYLRTAVGSMAQRAVVVHNGVPIPSLRSETGRHELRNELGIPEFEPVAIWVGSLDERKDPLAAIDAARKASVSLLVVGDGPLRSQVEREAGVSVRVLGHRRDVGPLLGASDLYVMTSQREGLAFSLLEAMAHGLPAIVTNVAENVEAIGDAGVAVPGKDQQALVAALRGLAGDDRERAMLGEKARRRMALFDGHQMLKRTAAVYDGVLARRRR